MTDGSAPDFPINPPSQVALQAAGDAWKKGALVQTIKAGTEFWRVIRAGSSTDARQFAQTCYPSPGLTRFAPVFAGPQIVPAAYAAETQELALWEVVLRGIRHEGIKLVPRHAVADRFLVKVVLLADRRLVDVTRPADAQLAPVGTRPPPLSGAWPSSYAVTRQWAQTLYDRLPGMEGIRYESHQLRGQCIVIYEARNGHPVFESLHEPQSVSEEPLRALVILEASKAGAGVNFEIEPARNANG